MKPIYDLWETVGGVIYVNSHVTKSFDKVPSQEEINQLLRKRAFTSILPQLTPFKHHSLYFATKKSKKEPLLFSSHSSLPHRITYIASFLPAGSSKQLNWIPNQIRNPTPSLLLPPMEISSWLILFTALFLFSSASATDSKSILFFLSLSLSNNNLI